MSGGSFSFEKQQFISDFYLSLIHISRYYERQFITRENKNKMILGKMEGILDEYITSGKLQERKLPTSGSVSYTHL